MFFTPGTYFRQIYINQRE